MPLTMTKAGDTVTIRKITGKDEVRQHLAELGFVVGRPLPWSMRSAATSSFRSRKPRIALDKTLAMRIIVA